jgi:hypothetical protein
VKFESELARFQKRAVQSPVSLDFKQGMIWKARVTEEFRNRLGPDFGVYVIRDKEKRVLYIGKGGTVKTHGQIGNQTLSGRLKNVRGKDRATHEDISSQQWMEGVVEEYGPVEIECWLFQPDQHLSPAYAEACLIQAYREDHGGTLPPKNRSF